VSIKRSPTPPWQIVIYGLSSILDGLIMIASLGFRVSAYRHACALWIARIAQKGSA
jgi:hypothetical protein